MEQFSNVIFTLKGLIWSPPFFFWILATGLFLTIRLRGIQIRYLGYGFRQLYRPQDKDQPGDISHFEALMTSLAGAIGTGSITGIAVGLMAGGVGALFWLWVTAFFGMAIRYTEAFLAVRYRDLDHRGEMVGGPMEYIFHGLGWKKMAIFFAIFGAIAAIGTGNLIQVNSISNLLAHEWGINPWWSGLLVAFLTGIVLIGGIQWIARVSSIFVPFMALFYVGGGLLILAFEYKAIPHALYEIFTTAFTGQAAVGGFLGSSVMLAIQAGVSRSILASEAGLGISSIAAAAARTDYPSRQAFVAMIGVFISTIIVCSITGLVLAVSGVIGMVDSHGAPIVGASLAAAAFQKGLVGSGFIVTIGLILFAYSTVMAWAYYGEKCCEFLFGERSIIWYRVLYTLIIIPGALLDLHLVWGIADVCNGLMIIPNLLAITGLSGLVVKETREYLAKEGQ